LHHRKDIFGAMVDFTSQELQFRCPIGYTIFEFNDELNKKNITNGPLTEQFFGITLYSPDQSHFRQGKLLYDLPTGPTKWAGGTLPNYNYPVYKLISVQAANGQTLLANLKSIFSQVK
jgi:hypothetical protein